MKNKLLSLLALVATGVLVSPAIQAQEISTSRTSEVFEQWTLTCATTAEGSACEMVQSLTNTNTGREALRLTIRGIKGEAAAERVLRIRAPLRVMLAQGIRLNAASINVALPYNICDPQGCYATLPIDTTTIRSFSTAETGDLVFSRPGLEEPVVAKMSFLGFADAMEAFEDKLR